MTGDQGGMAILRPRCKFMEDKSDRFPVSWMSDGEEGGDSTEAIDNAASDPSHRLRKPRKE